MLGVLGWTWEGCKNLTLAEITNAYDGKVLHDWDQASMLTAVVYNVGVIVASFGKSKAKPRTMKDFHPYRDGKKRGMRITAQDIGVLKMVGDAMVRNK